MFKIFCSSKIFLLCSNLFLLKIVRIAYFCWQLIFLKFDLQVLPQAILAQFMQVCIYDYILYSFLKIVWPFKGVVNFLLFCFLYISCVLSSSGFHLVVLCTYNGLIFIQCYGLAISLVLRTFLKNIWFSILLVYCFLNISVLSLTVFPLQFCAKYFEVKLRNKVRFRLKIFRICLCVFNELALSNSSLLQWKLETKLFPIQFLDFFNILLFHKMP